MSITPKNTQTIRGELNLGFGFYLGRGAKK